MTHAEGKATDHPMVALEFPAAAWAAFTARLRG